MGTFKKSPTFVSLIILLVCCAKLEALDSLCGADWLVFKDEKCFKAFDEIRTFEEAEKNCSKLETASSMAIIHTKDEQEFLQNYLFKTLKKVDNAWIGAKFANSSSKFKWIDESELSYANWDSKGPRNKPNYCVQMQADESVAGKWIDEPCEKKNLVLCQKAPTWSLAHVQKVLVDSRKEQKGAIEQSDKKIEDFKVELAASQKTIAELKTELKAELVGVQSGISNLKQNPVPIGFIYVQLPGQSVPSTLWPVASWSDVTTDYAGLFFRAEGGDSSSFGSLQSSNAPHLTTVNGDHSYVITPGTQVGLKQGEWSNNVFAGFEPKGGTADGYAIMRFFLSTGEVRPVNKAVRIWKRSS